MKYILRCIEINFCVALNKVLTISALLILYLSLFSLFNSAYDSQVSVRKAHSQSVISQNYTNPQPC